MRRYTTLFFFLALVIGFILFKVKYEVVEIEEKISQTLRKMKRERETIHILKAEWSHLNEPQRLQKLAEKFLDIRPMKAEQIANIRHNLTDQDPFRQIIPQTHLVSMKGEE
ncbi:MAG: hypothetical protein JSR85_05375 [Proteobacteria bacterium]|nr:hypothetical protein [Pseudomonadota bacterium]